MKCLTTKKGRSLATVSIVTCATIGKSVAPALPEGNAIIRLCKEKVWQGRALQYRMWVFRHEQSQDAKTGHNRVVLWTSVSNSTKEYTD
jgi:hypothetical protein